MIADALLAYFHFAAIILLFSLLAIEAVLLRHLPDAATIGRLARADMFYFLAAMLVLASGVMRLFWGAKGAAFYTSNPVFHTKVGLFILIGALSILPTMQILRWAKAAKASASFAPTEAEWRRARRIVMIEIHLAALLPLLAVFMSRGMGIK